jgi:L-iditol 2-dehydrogenase
MDDEWSRRGLGNLSEINYAIGHQFPGGFAEYCLLNEMTVRWGPVARIPSDLSYDAAALAELLACCINGLERANMAFGKSVLVVGAGPAGLLLAMAADAFGASLTVVGDSDPTRRDWARKAGIRSVVDTRGVSPEELDRRFPKGRAGFDVVMTACSDPEAQEWAVGCLAKRGVLNFFGGLPGGTRAIAVPSNALHYKEACLTGSHGSTPAQHGYALRALAAGRIRADALITHRFTLDRIADAYAAVEQRKGLKAAVKPWFRGTEDGLS